MTEEQVTKAILSYLINNGWHIVCFDFPQSGTGRLLHPNGTNEKNKGAINPDIVAVRNEVGLFFENKDRFYYPDYEKVNDLIENNDYSEAIAQLLAKYSVETIFYGIGLPTQKHGKSSEEATHLVDFIIGVNDDKTVSILHNASRIRFAKAETI